MRLVSRLRLIKMKDEETREIRERIEFLDAQLGTKKTRDEQTREIRGNRVWAACALIGIAISFAAIKAIDWNDCATYAVNIGIPTVFTIDEGCFVLSPSGASAVGRLDITRDDNYKPNHPTLASGFYLLGIFSFILGVRYVPLAIGDFITQRKVKADNEKLAESLKQGLFCADYAPGAGPVTIWPNENLAVMREAQDIAHRKRRYQLKQINIAFPVYPDAPMFENTELPGEEFETIEDAKERMEEIAPLTRWKPMS